MIASFFVVEVFGRLEELLSGICVHHYTLLKDNRVAQLLILYISEPETGPKNEWD